MREYATVSPQFWTGPTGKRIRGLGAECQVVALYLITSPHANGLGLYYLPGILIAHEVGISSQGASKALQRLSEEGFCSYDEDAEVVWVHEMAKYQIGPELKGKDNRIKWVNDEYHKLPKCKFLHAFWEKYGAVYRIAEPRALETPSKPLRSQDQEQEQEEEEDSLRSSSCAEVLTDSTPETITALVCTLPLNDGTEHKVRQDFVEQMQRLYPAVDVIQELKRMKGWIIGNPKNRKTKRGITAFITRWLDKEQNKARASPGSLLSSKQPVPGTYAQAQDAERRATALRILERSKQHGNLADHRGHGGAAIDIAAQLPERT